MLNTVSIMGRLKGDPDYRISAFDYPVATFSVICERDFNGNAATQADTIHVVAKNGNAHFVSKHFVKGDMIAVVGRLQTKAFFDNSGRKHEITEVYASNIYYGNSENHEEAQLS